MQTIKFVDGVYKTSDGGETRREYDSLFPNGNKFDGKWVYRNADGFMVDFDRYRNDLFSRNYFIVGTLDDES